MKVLEDCEVRPFRSNLAARRLLRATFVASLLLLLVDPILAGPIINTGRPIDFFTNVAARLLRSELSLDLSNIQVYPTNQYTPAVHRLLQVAANLYDATTNRALAVTPQDPYCPSVFRPIFRRMINGTNSLIVIAGYQEVLNADIADVRLAPTIIELDSANPPLMAFPVYGTPFSFLERNEPMVSGVPLIIGARRGFPNFNEFSMQTLIYVSRLLEFRRAPGSSTSPVIQTNQMYVLGITNAFGLEAWNSYLTNYPRDLQLVTSVSMTAIMTNENGAATVLLSNRVIRGAMLSIPANSWSGWTTPNSASASFILPWGTTNSFPFLSNSTYVNQAPWFVPQSHIFSAGDGFYVPHWWLNLNARLLFILVDTTANRIVDYVNLNHWESTLDITAMLAEGNSAMNNPLDYRNAANEWLTNRFGNFTSPSVPTYGILNQIQVGLSGARDLSSYSLDPYSGPDVSKAIDEFRFNLGYSPNDTTGVYYKSNVFYAPFIPYRPIYIHTSWQANDPLVHYMVSDLVDLRLSASNGVNFISSVPSLPNLGRINTRYKPWGGNPQQLDPTTDFQIAVKDPLMTRSDNWNFPTNQPLAISWVGQVHRGTPWQTLFLKSTNILLQSPTLSQGLQTWQIWTGNDVIRPAPDQANSFVFDAGYTLPTNDWHLVSLLNRWFTTNDLRSLASPNLASEASFAALLDGMIVLTNSAAGVLVMSSNSPQAATISQGIIAERLLQPDQVFRDVGDLLAVPELSIASPWLGPGLYGISDQALEIIPSQLLPLLRADSIGALSQADGTLQIQFTGFDEYSYALQASSNLVNWVSLSTNSPSHGVLSYPTPSPPGTAELYFRSVLLP